MSFSALLGKITKDKKLEEKAKLLQTNSVKQQLPKQSKSNSQKKPISLTALSTLSYPQDHDPAVARLKEARRLEKEKLMAFKNAKYGTKLSSSSKKSLTSTTKQRTPRQHQQQQQQQQQQKSPPLPPPPQKSRFKFKPLKHNLKLSDTNVQRSSHVSFSQLMEQASKIENPLTATSFHFIKKSNSKDSQSNQPSRAYQSLQKSRSKKIIPPQTNQTNQTDQTITPSQPSRQTFAKPNPELLKRLQKKPRIHQKAQPKKRTNTFVSSHKSLDNYDIDAQDDDDDIDNYEYDNYDDYEDDGFIVNDDDDDVDNDSRQRQFKNMQSQGYSKDEIWSIFNRGRKRDFHDYDDFSDMEATGTEILEEEDRTLKAAKIDDLREQKLLEQKAREKRRKLNRL